MADLASTSASEDFSPSPLKREPSLPIYPLLQEHKRQIRLIELLPGVEGVVRCKFQTLSLGEESNYASLSYVWGNSRITKEIIVDGISVDVTTNLENALRHIRTPTEARLIWVDALCINQIDHPEKTSQIKMMGDIYKNSSQGLLWLGDFPDLGMDVNQATAVKAFIHFLADEQHMATLPSGNLPCFSSTCHDFYLHAFGGLGRLLASSWWTRIWTVQEVVLPTSSSLVFGHHSISWQEFENAAIKNIDHGWSCCEHMTEPSDMASLLNKWTSHCFSISNMRQGNEAGLAALWRFRDRAATDPRDKVLGVLGLIPDLSFGVKNVDFYDMSVADLYHRLTIALITHHGDLSALSGRRGEPASVQGLASWAIDWTIPPKSSERWPWEFYSRFWIQYCRFDHFQACDTLELVMKHSDASVNISLDGIFIDKILGVGEPTAPDVDQHRTVQNWRRLCPNDGSYITGQCWDEAFYRTMIGDLITDNTSQWPNRSPKKEERQHFDNYMSANGEESGIIEESIRCNIDIQRFFITSRGFIGVGSPVLGIGDEVWVLGGGNLPFVLRRDANYENEDIGRNCYTLLGESYVHGIMNGEAVMVSEGKVETITLQ